MATTEVRETYTAPAGGAVTFDPWPGAVHLVDTDLVQIGPKICRMVNGLVTATLPDLPPGAGWRVTVKREGAEKKDVFYITGQLSPLLINPATFLDLGAIPRVDPDTFEITPELIDAWAELLELRDEVVDLAEPLLRVGIDTDGVTPYFDPAGVPSPVLVLLDVDGRPYVAIGA